MNREDYLTPNKLEPMEADHWFNHVAQPEEELLAGETTFEFSKPSYTEVATLSYRLKREVIVLGQFVSDLPEGLRDSSEELAELYIDTMQDVAQPNPEVSVEQYGNWYIDAVMAKRAAYFKALEIVMRNENVQNNARMMDKLSDLLAVDETTKFAQVGSCYDFGAIRDAVSDVRVFRRPFSDAPRPQAVAKAATKGTQSMFDRLLALTSLLKR